MVAITHSTRINFHPFADGAALHNEGSHRLWVLNHSSAVLWCLLEEHGPGERLIEAYAGHFGIPVERARADTRDTLAEFRRNGLYGEEEISQLPAVNSRPQGLGHKPHATRHQSSAPSQWQQAYRVAGVSWQIRCSETAAAGTWFDCLAHFISPEGKEADLVFEIMKEEGGWALSGVGEQVADLADDQVLPWLLTLLFVEFCHRQPQSLLLHAAVARRDDRLLLLPGESTFGKSTLAVALAASGWTLYSDELAPIDPTTCKVFPFPLPVGIKHRSLPALANCLPQLDSRPIHRRADGQLVRYLAPPQIDLADPTSPPLPVAALIFPRFHPDASGSILECLPPLSALDLLARTGSSERPLETRDVQALLTLASERPCWKLEYADLDQAIKQIDMVMGKV